MLQTGRCHIILYLSWKIPPARRPFVKILGPIVDLATHLYRSVCERMDWARVVPRKVDGRVDRRHIIRYIFICCLRPESTSIVKKAPDWWRRYVIFFTLFVDVCRLFCIVNTRPCPLLPRARAVCRYKQLWHDTAACTAVPVWTIVDWTCRAFFQ